MPCQERIDAGPDCLLAPFRGARPPAPRWFDQAVRAAHEATSFACDGAAIELLCWGGRGRPGILLLHGSGAHAHWWSPIAPLLADRFRVAALSWSGMGGSNWRASYSVAGYADEAIAAAEVAGLFDGGPPVVVAHSFGGSAAMLLAARNGDRFAGVILADSFVDPVNTDLRQPPTNPRHRIYPTLDAALARFRFSPPQHCANDFYADWIARHALRRIAAEGGAPAGWTWRFDPAMWGHMTRADSWRNLAEARCPVALIRGAQSAIMPDPQWALAAGQAPPGSERITLANAAHHLMVDQPQAFAAEVRRIAVRQMDNEQ